MDTKSELINRPRPSTWSIPELVAEATSGNLRIPNFQRKFTWDQSDVKKLFDSIWRGFPIGNLLLWRNRAEAGTVNLGPISIQADARPDALWVVDGQQRITSIVCVLNKDFKAQDERFQIYFDLRRKHFVSKGKGVPPWWIPVSEALETRTLLSWLREKSVDLEEDDLTVADALGGAIRDYQVPAYIVEGNDDSLLREVFDRVNSAGKPIGRAETFHALFASESEPGSPATVVESLKRLRFGEIDADRVVQSLLALRGGDVQRDIRDEFDAGEDPAEWYDLVEVALERAISFLRSEGVPHLLLTPSSLPLPVLAVFFHLHPDPDPWTRQLLSKWLWRGWALGFGQTGQTPALRQAIRAVNPKKKRNDLIPNEFDAVSALIKLVPDDEPPVPALEPFKTNSAAGRLCLLALASLTPLDREGNPVDIASELGKNGSAAITELVPSKRANLASRGFWPIEMRRPNGNEDDNILMSHGIDSVAAHALRIGNIDEFLEARSSVILPVIRNYVSVRVDARALIRPPLSNLLVED
ncbi:DUF262 domain-containing protein [Glycomyces sp. YM15]|uniref:DUF262 domain-containing protein n=1 Tax=Glycomyces sp. YM15 TaxID=2800446 RepID=UPI001962EF77|nr:DUF262 domain-containing protein [Glycomyces sp. YM15]